MIKPDMSNASEQNLNPDHKISVLVLTFNHGAYIADCVKSILQSAMPGMHVWVLDDGSGDHTLDVLEQMAKNDDRITVLSQPNSGGKTAANTQRLIDESRGEYILFMSGDDMLGPCFPIARSIAALEADPDLTLVLPRLLFLNEDAVQTAPHIYEESFFSTLQTGNPKQVLENHLYTGVSRLFLQGLIARRQVIHDAGGFDSDLLADDYAFILRLFQHMSSHGQRFIFDPSSLWLYRIHDSNVHRASLRQFRLILEVVQKYVPSQYWADFQWDLMAFATLDDLREARQALYEFLGAGSAVRLVRRMEKTTLRAARKRSDANLLREAIWDKDLRLSQRLKAAFCLIPLNK